MVLFQTVLERDLLSLFEDPPETAALCAQRWAEAMENYASTVLPRSSTASAASAALELSLVSLFSTSLSSTTTSIAMEAAWLTFATTLGIGMAPDWVSTPPPGPIGFSLLFEARPETHREAASNFATSIHLWLLTGIAVNSTSGATVNWS